MQTTYIIKNKKKRVKNINVLTISCSTKVFDVLITASIKK